MSIAAESPSGRDGGAFVASVGASAILHVAIIAAFLAMRPATSPPMPPVYRVNIIAAAPGAPAAGVITPPAAVPEPETKAPPRPKTEEIVPVQTKSPPRRTAKLATPSVSTKRVDRSAPAPVAGGGETGGKGTDVANVRTEGIDFPFPGYLENIVRQIALRFRPPRGSPLKAEVMFLIRRDGSVTAVQFRQRSGSFTFDLEAQGAVEAAGKLDQAGRSSFGPLPTGFREDVLPVVFSFDPSLIR